MLMIMFVDEFLMGQKSAEIAESCESWRDNRVQGGALLAGPALDAKPGVGAASILSNRYIYIIVSYPTKIGSLPHQNRFLTPC